MPKSTKKNSSTEVLLLSQLFYPELISTGQTLTELLEELSETGVNCSVICGPMTVLDRGKRTPKKITHKGIQITRVWGSQFPKEHFVGKLINHLTFFSFAALTYLRTPSHIPVMVVTNPPFLPLLAALKRHLFKGNPFIYIVFDVYPETAIKMRLTSTHSLLSFFWRRINNYIHRHASSIVVIGRCMNSVQEAKTKLSDKKKITMIPVWGGDSLILNSTPNPSLYRDKWNLNGKCVLLYSGNMARFHDIESIVEAGKRLQNHPEIVIVFVGKGYKRKWLDSQITKFGLSNIQLHDHVPRENLADLLSIADIHLVSLMAEQVGLSVPSKTYAAMATGKPIIAIMPEQCEIAQMINEETCGAVIAPNSPAEIEKQILNYYNSPSVQAQHGKNARAAITQKYGLKITAQRYLTLIQSLQIK